MQINSLIIAALAIVLFWLGYQFYSRAFAKVWDIDENRKTPAVTNYDGVDYVPAKHWTMLFGHHFASIAGAAPVVGPIIALSLWGWGPTLLWIVLGSVLFGGIHDFGSLMVSLRSEGNSIADVASNVISRRAKIVFSIFIWLTLILIIAVFVHFCAKTFIAEPRIVIPTIGLIPLAMLVGFMLYDIKFNQISTTILALAILGGLIMLGNAIPIELVKLSFQVQEYTLNIKSMQIWSILLLVYAFFASIIPVHVLLQPRDYLCSFLLLAGIFLGFFGMVISRPTIQLPVFVAWRAETGYLWPMLFVTVACGAISGFHSLVASGTTSKQIANEKHARKIGYGAMIAEGLVALLAVLIVATAMTDMVDLRQILDKGGPVAAFGKGFTFITRPFLGKWGGLLAITILNAFILTTLDTATRIGRYLTQELFGIKNRYIATSFIIILGGFLGLSGKWNVIWPMFGTANQLVAALALIVVTSWLLAHGKSIKFTFLPALLMLITTVGALIYQIIGFLKAEQWILVFISFALLGLAFYMLLEVDLILFRAFKRRKQYKVDQGYV